MATVTLSGLWLHEAENLAVNINIRRLSTIDLSSARVAQVRTRAGGRKVVVKGPARPRTVNVTLSRVDRTSLQWIDDRLGDRLFLRDSRGRALFVTILEVDASEVVGADVVNVSFAAREVSGSVAV